MSKYSYYRKDITQDIFFNVVNASLFIFRNKGFFNTELLEYEEYKFPKWKKNIYKREWTLVKNKYRILKKEEVAYCQIALFRKAARYMRINYFHLRDYFFSLSMIAYQSSDYCEQIDTFHYANIPFVFETQRGKVLMFEKRRLLKWLKQNSN